MPKRGRSEPEPFSADAYDSKGEAERHLKDPDLWIERVDAYKEYNRSSLDRYRKYCRWFSGDMEELRHALQIILGDGQKVAPLDNFVFVNTTSIMAELFYRAPRAYVAPQTNWGPGVFSPRLAEIEGSLLNDHIDEADLYGEGRKALLDGLLGPMMIFKTGYSNEIVQDDDLMDAERRKAQAEDLAIAGGGHPRVKETDYNPGHLEQHTSTLALMENGTFPVPASVIRYMKKHIKHHEDAVAETGDRPLETVRSESVFTVRVSPAVFACDPLATSSSRRRWVGEWFLRPVDEVREDRRYEEAAREKVEAGNFADLGRDAAMKMKKTRSTSTFAGEDMALIFEGVDLAAGKVITFAQGSATHLRYRDYTDRAILPAGPYVTASFAYDPLNDCGFPLPAIYEGHQEMVTYLDTLIAISARRSVPQMGVAAGALTPDDIESIKRGVPAALLTIKGLKPGDSIEKVIQRIPVPEAREFLFRAKAEHSIAAARFSLQGEAKTGGGDFSKTATAAAIVEQSGSNASEDRQSVLDDFLSRTLRNVMRLMRKRYSVGKVADIVGMKAQEKDGWPAPKYPNAVNGWSERDIVRDKAVFVVPGSSKRKNSAIDVKQATELLTVALQIPALQAAPTVTVELFRRITEAAGYYALDLTEMLEAAKQAEVEAAMAGQMPQEPGSPEGPGRPNNPERRASSRGEGTHEAMRQGAMNVGGGRVPRGMMR